MDYVHHLQTPLGGVTLASDGEALIGLWFDGQRHFGYGLDPSCREAEVPVFREAERWLAIYFSGRDPGFVPALRPRGTAFQQRVWDCLRRIPYGQTVTYGQIAEALVPASSPRAVGGAVGRNPISLIIPCHRVLGADRSLTGYAGSTERKRALLTLENAADGFVNN